MVKIVTDTSALFTVEEGERLGIHVIPLCITINDKHIRDLCSVTEEFLTDIRAGGIPTSSQPPIGEVIKAFETYEGEEVLNICMADGLSGTYQTALSAKEQASNKDDIIVLNSTSLCGPHRYLVEKAKRLADEGKNLKEVCASLQESMNHIHSFLIPQDFNFLKRGGRLKPAAATLGGLLKLKPIMQAVENGTRLDKYTIARTMGKATEMIATFFEEQKVGKGYKIYVSHAHALETATMIMSRLKERFKEAEFEMLELSHAFITQGGPECIAIQYIKM